MFKAILDDDLATVTGGFDSRQVGRAASEGFKEAVDYDGPGGVVVAPFVGAIKAVQKGGRNAAQQLGW